LIRRERLDCWAPHPRPFLVFGCFLIRGYHRFRRGLSRWSTGGGPQRSLSSGISGPFCPPRLPGHQGSSGRYASLSATVPKSRPVPPSSPQDQISIPVFLPTFFPTRKTVVLFTHPSCVPCPVLLMANRHRPTIPSDYPVSSGCSVVWLCNPQRGQCGTTPQFSPIHTSLFTLSYFRGLALSFNRGAHSLFHCPVFEPRWFLVS